MRRFVLMSGLLLRIPAKDRLLVIAGDVVPLDAVAVQVVQDGQTTFVSFFLK